MKRNPGKKRKQQLIQVWSYDQIVKALPYLLEVLRSLRENYLAMRFANHHSAKISQRKGRPDRSAYIAKQEAQMDSEAASLKYNQDVAEFESMGMFVVSPENGIVAIPFIEEEQLAWFILELYHEDYVVGWRFQSDPLETRRAILPKHKGAA
ncbi:MAG: hypothetical protein EBT92_07265 [Planctomycetes bacterium]|nr:hypothetical protein [Planctomycetota bacterium]NBY03303.1 hypothetical protein [Planctomycetota bacterium]